MLTGRRHVQKLSLIGQIAVILFTSATTASVGQEQSVEEPGGQSLDQAANDPTASLMSFQVQDFYSPNFYDMGDVDQNIVQFRAAIPYSIGGFDHIARLTQPIVTDSPSGRTGLADTTVFDLTVFNERWGRYGVGAVALLPTGQDGLSAEKWAIGPAAGFAVQDGAILWGLFNQNLFTVGGDASRPDVNVSSLQPLFNVSLGDGWSAGFSEMNYVYDWDKDGFTSLPLGVKLSKLIRNFSVPLQFQFSYEHNFYDGGRGPEDTYGFTVKVLLPSG